MNRFATTMVVVMGLALGAPACGAEDDGPASVELGDPSMPGRSTNADAGPCKEGYVRSCTIYLPEQNGVENCVEGLQACREGVWGECQDPDEMDVEGLAEFSVDTADTMRAPGQSPSTLQALMGVVGGFFGLSIVAAGIAVAVNRRRNDP